MRSGITRVLVGAVVFSALVLGPGAQAGHNEDDHTENLTYEGTSPQNAFTNSDLAFWGDRVYAGNYGGFRIIDGSDPTAVEDPANVLLDYSCPGPQNDISVWDNDDDPEPDLLFLSVDSPRTNDTCANAAASGASDPTSWEGVRIFDINDISNDGANVQQIAAVPTDCGSHTHTLVPDKDDPTTLYVYVSSYPLGTAALTNDIPADNTMTPPRAAGTKNDGTECREPEGDNTKAHNKISIIKVNLAAPATADDRIAAGAPGCTQATGWCYPNVKEWALDGQTKPTFRTIGDRLFEFSGCHDISVFLPLDRAAGACWEEGQFWDISDPWNPLYLRRIRTNFVDTLFHSATWTWDGKVVAFEDEAGGGGAARCKLEDGEPDQQGAMYFYNRAARHLGTFKIPRHIEGTCTAHNYNVLPVTNGKYVLSSAWYQGGTSVINFTNPARAREVGYYVAKSPVNGQGNPVNSNVWSSYWYNGAIWANDIPRGLDVFTFDSPLTDTVQTLDQLNPQTQLDLIPQTYTTPTRHALAYGDGSFRGQLSSTRAACLNDREIVVRRVRPGRDQKIGEAMSNSKGRWHLDAKRSTLNGPYYAVARATSISDGSGNTIACKRGTSNRVRF